MIRPLVLAAAAVLGLPQSPSHEARGREAPRVIEVRMIDKSPTEFAFEPADLTVRPGDVIRFVQKGIMPHNVQFTGTPEGVALEGSLAMGPYLTRGGETYDIAIDDRFTPGKYDYVCTPHAPLGMTGTITVESGPTGRPREVQP